MYFAGRLPYVLCKFPDEKKVVSDVLVELETVEVNEAFRKVMFSDQAIGRTKELLGRYPEMKASANIFMILGGSII